MRAYAGTGDRAGDSRSRRLTMVCGVAAVLAAAPAGAQEATGRPVAKAHVALVMERLERAGSDATARDWLTAWLGGVVETMRVMDEKVVAATGRHLFCKPETGSLDGRALYGALAAAVPDPAARGSADATVIIVDHVLGKYPCPAGAGLGR